MQLKHTKFGKGGVVDSETNYDFDAWIDARGSEHTWKWLARAHAEPDNDRGRFGVSRDFNGDQVDRAADDGVIPARIRVPSWFVCKDDDWSDAFAGNYGDVVENVLLEDYSDKAFRVRAVRESDAMGDTWWVIRWLFVPKAVVETFTAVDAPETEDEYWNEHANVAGAR